MDKPKLSVKITSIEKPNITKIYTKANGLKSLTIDGVSNTSPYYGIISRGGSVTLIDVDGWLKEQSDNNILPDVTVDVYINNCLQYSFSSDNDVGYLRQNNNVTINLADSINLLQNSSVENESLYSDTNAIVVFSDIMNKCGVDAVLDAETNNYLQSLSVSQMVIPAGTYWDIIEQFARGVRAIFYKLGAKYFLKRMKE